MVSNIDPSMQQRAKSKVVRDEWVKHYQGLDYSGFPRRHSLQGGPASPSQTRMECHQDPKTKEIQSEDAYLRPERAGPRKPCQ